MRNNSMKDLPARNSSNLLWKSAKMWMSLFPLIASWLLISKCDQQQSGYWLEMWKGIRLWMKNKSAIKVVIRWYPCNFFYFSQFCQQQSGWLFPLTTISGFLWKQPETMIASVGPPVMKPITQIFRCFALALQNGLGLELWDGAGDAV